MGLGPTIERWLATLPKAEAQRERVKCRSEWYRVERLAALVEQGAHEQRQRGWPPDECPCGCGQRDLSPTIQALHKMFPDMGAALPRSARSRTRFAIRRTGLS